MLNWMIEPAVDQITSPCRYLTAKTDPTDLAGAVLPMLQFGDLEILYVVFDILYLDTGSVINRTLTERQELLRQALAPQQTEAVTIGALLCLCC